MDTDYIIITNNPLVASEYGEDHLVDYQEESFISLLQRVQRLVYEGHELLSHPLSGSVKPKETLYKSVLIAKKVAGLDLPSLKLIDNSIETCEKFHYKEETNEKNLEDMRFVDYTLISSAIASADV